MTTSARPCIDCSSDSLIRPPPAFSCAFVVISCTFDTAACTPTASTVTRCISDSVSSQMFLCQNDPHSIKEGHLACKKLSGGMLARLFENLHMAQLIPLPLTISCSSKSRLVLPFWSQLTWVVSDKPLNRCVGTGIAAFCSQTLLAGNGI